MTFKNLAEYTRDYFDLIIIPDASMTCKEAIQIRDNFNAEILVLDHHLITEEYFNNKINEWIEKKEAEELNFKNIKIDNYTNYCIAVNCHDDIYPNPDLSGVGVVQKFIEAYLNKYEEKESLEGELKEYFYDLVSLGMISDNISVKNPETRFYMVEGIKKYNQRNELINEIQIRNEEEFKFGRTIKNSGWVLGPRINAVIRYGKKEELDKLFKAILDVNETVEYQPRRKSKNDPIPDKETHTLQWDAARICDNVKARQDTEVRKFMKEIEQKIKDEDLLKNSVLFVDGTKVLTKDTVSGLVANKLASKYLRPVVLMREKSSTEYGGSARGYDKGPIKELNTFLSEAGVTAMGHSNAFGIQIPKDSLNKIIEICNRKMPVESLCTIHTVDWEIPANKLKKEYVQEVAENYGIFGNDVPEPLFAITDLHINASQINGYGENNGFIRFVYNGVTFIKKYCPIGDYEQMTLRDRKVFGVNKKDLILDLICQFTLNTWEDKINPEVKILYYGVKQDKEAKNNKINNKIHNTKHIIDIDEEFENITGKTNKNIELDDEDFIF